MLNHKRSGNTLETILKIVVPVVVAYFLYCFFKDSYEELFINPVHFFDDAYMFIRYARIWHLGYGESWNIGEGPVYGNTSQLHFLFVLLLTSFSQLSNEMVIKLSSYIPSFLFMCWLPFFCARHARFLSDRPLYQRLLFWTATACPFIYWQTPYAYHFLTGMDTALSMLMHLLLIDLVLSYAKRVNTVVNSNANSKADSTLLLILISVVLYLSFATRPENILPCGLFVVLYFSLVMKKTRESIFVVIVAGVLITGDVIFKYYYFGDVVPLAFYSKKVDYLQGFAAYVNNHPLLPVSHFLVMVWPLLTIQFFCYDKKYLHLMLAFAIPVLIVVLYFLTIMSIMNIRMRYEYPFVLYLLTATVLVYPGIGYNFRYNKANRSIWIRKGLVSLSVLALLMVLRINSAQLVRFFMKENPVCDMGMLNSAENFNREKYSGDEGLVHMSEFLQELPAGTKVVMTEHGYVGANNLQINIIDVIGLHNHYIAHHGFSADWLFAQKPDAIWVPHWNYTCLNNKIFSRQEFWDQYELYPAIFNWGLALRKDSPHYDVMLNVLRKKIALLYPEINLDELKQTAPRQSFVIVHDKP